MQDRADNPVMLASLPCWPRSPPHHGPLFQAPREVGHYSWVDGGELRFDRTSLSSYVDPSGTHPDGHVEGGDLNGGFPDLFYRFAKVQPETLDALLAAAERARAGDRARALGTSLHEPDFVTWRGVLRSFLTVPYAKQDEWELELKLDGKAVHVRSVGSVPRDSAAPTVGPGDVTRFDYYGYKFEAICSVPRGSEDDLSALAARAGAPVDPRNQYCAVLTSRLGPHRLLFGAEIDGALPPMGTGERTAKRMASDASLRPRPDGPNAPPVQLVETSPAVRLAEVPGGVSRTAQAKEMGARTSRNERIATGAESVGTGGLSSSEGERRNNAEALANRREPAQTSASSPLCAAPFDVVLHDEGLQQSYVELKTTVDWDLFNPRNAAARRWRYYRFRMLDTWAQCFVAGIPHVVLGLRNQEGALTRVIHLETRQIPRLVTEENPQGAWRADVCLQFAKELLDMLHAHVRELSPGDRWRYRLVKEASHDGSCPSIRLYDLGT